MKNTIAYLAGLIAADGHLSKNDGIAIYVKDREFVKKIVQSLCQITNSKISIYPSKGAFRINVFDKILLNALTQKFKIPMGKKSNCLIFPETLSKKEKLDFVRGYVDGDGSIYIDKRKRYGIINTYPRVEIASQSREFLDKMIVFLYMFGIKSGQVKSAKRTLRIRIYANNAKNFIEKIGFSHPTKILRS